MRQPALTTRRVNGSAARAIDRIDRRILKALQADGRKSISELAREVYLTTSPCLDRVHRLEQEGYIRGYTALLDPIHLGARLLAFAGVRVDRATQETFQKFRTLVESLDEIVECHMVAGGFDYLLKVRVADMDAYHRFFEERLSTLPGIVQITTYVAMEVVKSTTAFKF